MLHTAIALAKFLKHMLNSGCELYSSKVSALFTLI